jgi:hypothetical protein
METIIAGLYQFTSETSILIATEIAADETAFLWLAGLGRLPRRCGGTQRGQEPNHHFLIYGS